MSKNFNLDTELEEAGNRPLKLRNSLLTCEECGLRIPELEWDRVWSFKIGAFVAFCCPNCRAVGQSRYTNRSAEGSGKDVLYNLDLIHHMLKRKHACESETNNTKDKGAPIVRDKRLNIDNVPVFEVEFKYSCPHVFKGRPCNLDFKQTVNVVGQVEHSFYTKPEEITNYIETRIASKKFNARCPGCGAFISPDFMRILNLDDTHGDVKIQKRKELPRKGVFWTTQ